MSKVKKHLYKNNLNSYHSPEGGNRFMDLTPSEKQSAQEKLYVDRFLRLLASFAIDIDQKNDKGYVNHE
jgi:hypothetical protein